MIITNYYIVALVSGQYFTAGKKYFAYDGNIKTGLFVMDDDNKQHFLSPNYLLSNFEIYTEYKEIK